MDKGLDLKTQVGQYEVSTIGEIAWPEVIPLRLRKGHPWMPLGLNGWLQPAFYETAVFGPNGLVGMERYDNRQEAEEGHAETVVKWQRMVELTTTTEEATDDR